MWRFSSTAKSVLPLLCLLVTCCAEELPEPEPPEVTYVNVSEGAEVGSDQTIVVTFSKKMESVSIDVSGATGITTPSSDHKGATWKPSSDMSPGSHRLMITGKDVFNQDLEGFTPINFKVTDLPEVTYTSVFEGDRFVSLDNIVAKFSKEMESVSMDVSDAPGTTVLNGRTAEWEPLSDMSPGIYELTVTGVDTQGYELEEFTIINFMVMGQLINTKIAYQLSTDIYVMNVEDSTDQVNLTNSPANDSHPSWSPDGIEIAFVRDGDIYVMNAEDGADQVNLTDSPANDSHPSWSPSGGSDNILREFQDLNRNGVWDPGEPYRWVISIWQIAFESGGDIYVIYDGDFTIENSLTNSPAKDSQPSYSPDGMKIAFVRDGDIYVMNADGTDQVECVSGNHPSWSPDGSMIAFDLDGYIYVVNADGKGHVKLTPGEMPSWSPFLSAE